VRDTSLDLLLPGRTIHTTDSAGRSVAIRVMRELRGAPAQQDPRIERLMEQAASLIQSAFPRWLGIVMGLSFPAGIFTLQALFNNSVPIWAFAAPYMLVMMSIFSFLVRRRMRTIGPALGQLFVQEGICAGCGYNLFGVSPHNGVVTCPECGAAWAENDIRRSEPIVLTSAEPLLRDQARRGFRAYVNNLDRRSATDDAGRVFAPVRMRMLRRVRATAADEHREALDAAISELRFAGCVPRVAGGLFFVALAITVAVPNFMVVARLRSAFTLMTLFPMLMMLLFGLALLASDAFRPVKRVVKVLRQVGLCPSCAQRIDCLAPSANALVTCPTCLCSWKTTSASPVQPA
jgi:uncharacterized Zn finger protein (UPF0148 family)